MWPKYFDGDPTHDPDLDLDLDPGIKTRFFVYFCDSYSQPIMQKLSSKV